MDQQTEKRLRALRERMAREGVDLVALGPSKHMLWLAGLDPHGDERPVMVLVSAEFCGVLMPELNAAAARTQTDLPFFEWADHQGAGAALSALVAACKVPGDAPSIALDETMRADFALLLLAQFDAPRHQFTETTIGYLRSRKDKAEHASLKDSARINDLAFAAAFKALRPGMTERELCAVIKQEQTALGAVPSFTIVCFGTNGAFPHHSPGETALQCNMPVLIDAGCRVDGYNSDMTRCGWYGTPTDEFRTVAAVVEAALDAGLARAEVGLPAREVDKAVRSVIDAAGYGAFFPHRTGHGLGLDVHEPPYLTATSDTELNAGHVFTVEPGIYLPDKFGIRLEEDVYLHPTHAEVLSRFARITFVS